MDAIVSTYPVLTHLRGYRVLLMDGRLRWSCSRQTASSLKTMIHISALRENKNLGVSFCIQIPLRSPAHVDSWGVVHAYKVQQVTSVITASLRHIFSRWTPPYPALLDLDRKIPAFPVPSHLRSPIREDDTEKKWDEDGSKAMQQYCVVCTRESSEFLA